MAVRTYDPNDVIVAIGGVIMGGFADGTFIEVERDEDTFSKVTGADGEVSRAKSNNRSGMATLTLKQTSPSNDILSGFQVLDELSNTGVVPVLVKENNTATILMSGEGWVRKPPNAVYSKEVEDRVWVLDLSDVGMFNGGRSLAS